MAESTVSALGDGDCDEVGKTLSQGNVFPEGRGDPDGIVAGNSPNQPGLGASGVGTLYVCSWVISSYMHITIDY